MRVLCLLPLALLLGACKADLPGSFQVSSVAVRAPVDPGEMLPWYSPDMSAGRQPIRLLRIEVLADVDLVDYAKREDFNVGFAAYYCDDKGTLGNPVYSTVYPMIGEHSMGNGLSSSPKVTAEARDAQGRIPYAFIVPLDEPPLRDIYNALVRKSNVQVPLYDYGRAGAENLCLQIRGGAMWTGRHFAAAPIIVPRADILKAVAAPN